MHARRVFGTAKVFDFHLLKFARAKGEIAGRDFVAKRFTDLRDAKRQFLAAGCLHVQEIDENALRCFGAQIGDVGAVFFIYRANTAF